MKIHEILEESKKITPPKPRNFVAKNAKSAGAGAHKDKKKDLKQGIAKHKKKVLPESASLDEALPPDQLAKLQSIRSQLPKAGAQKPSIPSDNDRAEADAWLSQLKGDSTSADVDTGDAPLNFDRPGRPKQLAYSEIRTKIAKLKNIKSIVKNIDKIEPRALRVSNKFGGADEITSKSQMIHDVLDNLNLTYTTEQELDSIEHRLSEYLEYLTNKAAAWTRRSKASKHGAVTITRPGEEVTAEGSPRQLPKRHQSAIDAFNRFMDEPESTPKDDLQSRHVQIKNQIKNNTMAGPKGVLPEQGVAEGRLEYDKKTGQMKINKVDLDQRHGLYMDNKLVKTYPSNAAAENVKARDKKYADAVIKKITEDATLGAISTANMGSIPNPHHSPGPARGKTSYIGSPGKSGTKAPPQPKVKQPKNADGTAKNGVDMPNIFGNTSIKRT